MDLGLADKRVFVTGGTGGIGAAVVRAFAREGARVALTYHSSADRANDIVSTLGGPGRALALRYDLSDFESAAAAIRQVEANWGGVDILVSSAVRWAALGPFEKTSFHQTPADAWLPVLRANLEGQIRTAQLLIQGMRTRRWGRIAFISSYHATEGTPGSGFYGAAKAGLHGLMRGLAWDAGTDGVFVNVIAPGLTRTSQIVERVAPERLAQEAAGCPSGQLSEPDDVAKLIVFICSAANGNVTGEVISIAGGY